MEAESLEGESGVVVTEGRCLVEHRPDCSGPAPSSGAWRTLIEKVQEARGHARLRHLSFSGKWGEPTGMLEGLPEDKVGLCHDLCVLTFDSPQE